MEKKKTFLSSCLLLSQQSNHTSWIYEEKLASTRPCLVIFCHYFLFTAFMWINFIFLNECLFIYCLTRVGRSVQKFGGNCIGVSAPYMFGNNCLDISVSFIKKVTSMIEHDKYIRLRWKKKTWPSMSHAFLS